MATVEQRINDHLTALNLSPDERSRAKAAANELNVLLRRDFDPQGEVRQGGSLQRGTAIRPLKDVDLLVVLSAKNFPTLRSLSPDEVMRAIQAKLQGMGLPARVQNRSLGLNFKNIPFDLVLCWRDSPESHVLRLPDLGRHSWLKTNPAEHARLGDERDKGCNQRLRPLIRGMKAWNVSHGKPLRSFHIEVMMWEVWKDGAPKTWAEGLQLSFSRLADRVLRPTADPAEKGPKVDEDVTGAQRAHASRLLSEAASLAATLPAAADPQAVLNRLLGPKPA
ncbi:MAG: hypothetical protein RIT28_3535 [Pseudomonadota bacterium]|jgi:hypothetical protein